MREPRLTMPILSANFLLRGFVSLLTNVPSGYRMNVNGESCVSARRPSHDRLEERWRRSDAHERLRKMKLKKRMP